MLAPNIAFGLLLTLASILTVAVPSSIAALLIAGTQGDPLTGGVTELRCLLVPGTSDVTLHLVSYGLLIMVLGAVAAGGCALLSDWYRTRRFVGRYLARPASGLAVIKRVVRKAGLEGRVDLVLGREPRCFCYGLVRPRVCITTGLVEALSLAQLEAVLRHEAYHVRCYDPLRLMLGRVLASAFFFVPILGDLFVHYRLHAELVADRQAVREMREPQSLAAALDKLLDIRAVGPSTLPGIGHGSPLELRIDSLLGDPVSSAVGTRPRLTLSALLVLLVAAPAVALLIEAELVLLAALAATPHATC